MSGTRVVGSGARCLQGHAVSCDPRPAAPAPQPQSLTRELRYAPR